MTCQATESCNGSDFLGINSAVREKIPQVLQYETQKKSFRISIQAKFINPSNTSLPIENSFSLSHIEEIWSKIFLGDVNFLQALSCSQWAGCFWASLFYNNSSYENMNIIPLMLLNAKRKEKCMAYTLVSSKEHFPLTM